MKNKIGLFMLGVTMLFLSCGDSTTLLTGEWKVSFNKEQKTVSIENGMVIIANDLYVTYNLDGKQVSSKDYADAKVSQQTVTDKFGKSRVFKVIYTSGDLPALTQYVYIQADKDYLLTEFELESNTALSVNYMAPVNVDDMQYTFAEGDNRALFIPFDNDKWIRFQSHPFSFHNLRSYEVTSFFNNESRNGFVIGSVEHDNWKTAIDMTSTGADKLNKLVCFGGVADELTRDSKEHGALKGKKVKSPKILLGYFNDWREGMETYADVNAVVNPPKAWNKAMPFGWNSWGVLQFNLTYQKALEVSDFFKEKLQGDNFINDDNTLYIGLDSGWNSFTEDELKSFVDHCKANGQVAGVYWTPFTDWGKNPEQEMNDAPEYKYKDVYLYANGNPQDLDGAYAIDPTHPAIEEQMKITSALFKRCGFEYVKMDFMTHGAMEADSWHNKEITTGMQAYNYGMKLLDDYFGDMFINLSISPVFPAHYAQSRRIACDAWNKIKDTEYTMNAVSYGWWIDRVYQYNDADHIVLLDATDGENRARITSVVITGLYIAGDDFSQGGSAEGKERAVKFLTNKEVNKVAKGDSFRPVEGNGEKSENQFIHIDKEGNTYYVVFNYSDSEIQVQVPLQRLGITATNGTELWSSDNVDLQAPLTVAGKDVKLIKISE